MKGKEGRGQGRRNGKKKQKGERRGSVERRREEVMMKGREERSKRR